MRNLTLGAYRLFFPAAGLFAALGIAIWLLVFSGRDLPFLQDGLSWHRHEMLFGYLGLALGGFLLTAIPNWTGRPAMAGAPLLALFGLWLIGRVGMVILPPGAAQAALVVMFPVSLAVLVSREILLAGNRRNLPIVAILWMFVVAEGLFLLGEQAIAQRLGFSLALILITLIGGRVTPAFSRNWLTKNKRAEQIPGFGRVDAVATVLAILAVVAWVWLPGTQVTGVLALLAAGSVGMRLLRWKVWAVADEVLLVALHGGYFWVVVSLFLLGLSALTGVVQPVQVMHAIGAGAVGSMTLIVMMRAILGHANRPIEGNVLDVAILSAVHLGALIRVIAPWADSMGLLVQVSGMIWAAGFALFFLRYGRISLMPRLQASHVDGGGHAQ